MWADQFRYQEVQDAVEITGFRFFSVLHEQNMNRGGSWEDRCSVRFRNQMLLSSSLYSSSMDTAGAYITAGLCLCPPPPPALTVLISTYAQAVTHTDSDVRTPFMAVQILNRSWSVLLRERPKVSESLWKSEDRCGEKVLQETRRSQPCFYFFCSKMFQFHQWPFSPPISSLTVDFCCLHFIWAWPRSWRDAHFCLSWLIPGWSR